MTTINYKGFEVEEIDRNGTIYYRAELKDQFFAVESRKFSEVAKSIDVLYNEEKPCYHC